MYDNIGPESCCGRVVLHTWKIFGMPVKDEKRLAGSHGARSLQDKMVGLARSDELRAYLAIYVRTPSVMVYSNECMVLSYDAAPSMIKH